MAFLDKAQRYTKDGIVAFILNTPKTGFKANPHTGVTWCPVGVVIHNTGEPDLDQWAAYSQAQREHWGDNLNNYYRGMGWHSGPHFAATPETWSYNLCDVQADGIHDSCRNVDYFGVETVGNFEVDEDDPNSAAGKQSLDNAINIVAALCVRFGFDPDKRIDFHRNCKRDGHACPGSLVPDQLVIGSVKKRVAEINKQPPLNVGPLHPSTLPHADTPMAPMVVLEPWPPETDPFFSNAGKSINKWLSYGVSMPFALAMTAQEEAESSFDFKAHGDHRSAYGLFQFHPDRCALIKSGTGIDIMKFPSIEQQIAGAWYELHSTERVAFDAISAAKTARDAGIAACVKYERAGAAMAAQKRGAMSERWAVYVQKNPDFLKKHPFITD